MQEDCYLSLHALSGKPHHKAIQLRALVQNQALIILVDSGSSHTFLSSSLAYKLQLAATPLAHMTIKVANGAVLPCTSEIKGFEWWIQGHTFHIDAKVLDMGAYDLVHAMDWLEQFSPMTCSWLEKWT
jgi:predicted aspartyl protease